MQELLVVLSFCFHISSFASVFEPAASLRNKPNAYQTHDTDHDTSDNREQTTYHMIQHSASSPSPSSPSRRPPKTILDGPSSPPGTIVAPRADKNLIKA